MKPVILNHLYKSLDKNGNWVVTNRRDLQTAIEKINCLKRMWICLVTKRKLHKLARAYSIVTVDHIYSDHPRTDEIWQKSDELWARLYDINYVPNGN